MSILITAVITFVVTAAAFLLLLRHSDYPAKKRDLIRANFHQQLYGHLNSRPND